MVFYNKISNYLSNISSNCKDIIKNNYKKILLNSAGIIAATTFLGTPGFAFEGKKTNDYTSSIPKITYEIKKDDTYTHVVQDIIKQLKKNNIEIKEEYEPSRHNNKGSLYFNIAKRWKGNNLTLYKNQKTIECDDLIKLLVKEKEIKPDYIQNTKNELKIDNNDGKKDEKIKQKFSESKIQKNTQSLDDLIKEMPSTNRQTNVINNINNLELNDFYNRIQIDEKTNKAYIVAKKGDTIWQTAKKIYENNLGKENTKINQLVDIIIKENLIDPKKIRIGTKIYINNVLNETYNSFYNGFKQKKDIIEELENPINQKSTRYLTRFDNFQKKIQDKINNNQLTSREAQDALDYLNQSYEQYLKITKSKEEYQEKVLKKKKDIQQLLEEYNNNISKNQKEQKTPEKEDSIIIINNNNKPIIDTQKIVENTKNVERTIILFGDTQRTDTIDRELEKEKTRNYRLDKKTKIRTSKTSGYEPSISPEIIFNYAYRENKKPRIDLSIGLKKEIDYITDNFDASIDIKKATIAYNITDNLFLLGGINTYRLSNSYGIGPNEINPVDLTGFIFDTYENRQIPIPIIELNNTFRPQISFINNINNRLLLMPKFKPNKTNTFGNVFADYGTIKEDFKKMINDANFQAFVDSWYIDEKIPNSPGIALSTNIYFTNKIDIGINFARTNIKNPVYSGFPIKGLNVDLNNLESIDLSKISFKDGKIKKRYPSTYLAGLTFEKAIDELITDIGFVLHGETSIKKDSFMTKNLNSKVSTTIESVLGISYMGEHVTNLGVQFMNTYITDSNDLLVFKKNNPMVGGNILIDLESLFSIRNTEFNLDYAFGLDKFNYMIQPSLKFNIYDGINLELGASFLGGKKNTPFGNFEKNDRIFFNFIWDKSLIK
jgi:hypothetical protein